MASDFVSAVKSFIQDKKLQDLSSDGWSRMKQVKRDLEAKKVTGDDAVDSFLKERDFRMTIGRDRHAVAELRKKIGH